MVGRNRRRRAGSATRGHLEGLAVFVGEVECRPGDPLEVSVELDVVFDLDEPLRQRAVDVGDAAVDVLDGAVGRLDEPRLDRPVLEAGVEPEPEVDLVRDPHPEGSVATAVEAVDGGALPVDLHPPGPGARLLDVEHVDDDSSVDLDVHRQQLPHRGAGCVVHLPLDAGGVRAELHRPALQRLDAGPAQRPGAEVRAVGGGDAAP